MTSIYGLKDEMKRTYGSIHGYNALMEAFDTLPIAAIVIHKILCLPGGLDPNLQTMREILDLKRFTELPQTGLWSSLVSSVAKEGQKDFAPLEAEKDVGHVKGHTGYLFGESQLDEFLRNTGLCCLIRSKQLIMNGYSRIFNGRCITIWSAPNFCGWIQNKGAVVQVVTGCRFDQEELDEQSFIITPFDGRPSDLRMEPNKRWHQDEELLDFLNIEGIQHKS
jgi:diadenosine tetraphosphatase ApaH/serine/threonine PP2A family protein phosphatase